MKKTKSEINKGAVTDVGVAGEKVRIWGSVSILLLAFVLFYYLLDRVAWQRWVTLVLGLLLSAGLFYTASAGKSFVQYFISARTELNKVVWPSRATTWQLFLYIVVFVVVLALYLFLVDSLISWVIFDLILGFFKK